MSFDSADITLTQVFQLFRVEKDIAAQYVAEKLSTNTSQLKNFLQLLNEKENHKVISFFGTRQKIEENLKNIFKKEVFLRDDPNTSNAQEIREDQGSLYAFLAQEDLIVFCLVCDQNIFIKKPLNKEAMIITMQRFIQDFGHKIIFCLPQEVCDNFFVGKFHPFEKLPNQLAQYQIKQNDNKEIDFKQTNFDEKSFKNSAQNYHDNILQNNNQTTLSIMSQDLTLTDQYLKLFRYKLDEFFHKCLSNLFDQDVFNVYKELHRQQIFDQYLYQDLEKFYLDLKDKFKKEDEILKSSLDEQLKKVGQDKNAIFGIISYTKKLFEEDQERSQLTQKLINKFYKDIFQYNLLKNKEAFTKQIASNQLKKCMEEITKKQYTELQKLKEEEFQSFFDKKGEFLFDKFYSKTLQQLTDFSKEKKKEFDLIIDKNITRKKEEQGFSFKILQYSPIRDKKNNLEHISLVNFKSLQFDFKGEKLKKMLPSLVDKDGIIKQQDFEKTKLVEFFPQKKLESQILIFKVYNNSKGLYSYSLIHARGDIFKKIMDLNIQSAKIFYDSTSENLFLIDIMDGDLLLTASIDEVGVWRSEKAFRKEIKQITDKKKLISMIYLQFYTQLLLLFEQGELYSITKIFNSDNFDIKQILTPKFVDEKSTTQESQFQPQDKSQFYQGLATTNQGQYFIAHSKNYIDIYNCTFSILKSFKVEQSGLSFVKVFSDKFDWLITCYFNTQPAISYCIPSLSEKSTIHLSSKEDPERGNILGNPFLDIIYLSHYKYGPNSKFLNSPESNQYYITTEHELLNIKEIKQYIDKLKLNKSWNHEFHIIEQGEFIKDIQSIISKTPTTKSKWLQNMILSRVPVQLCTVENGMVTPLIDGMRLQIQSGDSSDASVVERAKHITFSYMEKIFESSQESFFVVSIVGRQSSGKSYLMNRLFGSRFGVASTRCTDGAWMTYQNIENINFLILDCEGLFSARRTESEEANLIAFITGLSDITILNQDLSFNRYLDQLFCNLNKSKDKLKGDNLFKGKLLMAIRDVPQNGEVGAQEEMQNRMKLAKESSQPFLTTLFNDQFDVQIMHSFEKKKLFSQEVEQLRETYITQIKKSELNHWKNGKILKETLKILLIQLYCDDPQNSEDLRFQMTKEELNKENQDRWKVFPLDYSEKIDGIQFNQRQFNLKNFEEQSDKDQELQQIVKIILNVQSDCIQNKESKNHNEKFKKINSILNQIFQKRQQIVLEESRKRLQQFDQKKFMIQITSFNIEQENIYKKKVAQISLCLRECQQCQLICTKIAQHDTWPQEEYQRLSKELQEEYKVKVSEFQKKTIEQIYQEFKDKKVLLEEKVKEKEHLAQIYQLKISIIQIQFTRQEFKDLIFRDCITICIDSIWQSKIKINLDEFWKYLNCIIKIKLILDFTEQFYLILKQLENKQNAQNYLFSNEKLQFFLQNLWKKSDSIQKIAQFISEQQNKLKIIGNDNGDEKISDIFQEIYKQMQLLLTQFTQEQDQYNQSSEFIKEFLKNEDKELSKQLETNQKQQDQCQKEIQDLNSKKFKLQEEERKAAPDPKILEKKFDKLEAQNLQNQTIKQINKLKNEFEGQKEQLCSKQKQLQQLQQQLCEHQSQLKEQQNNYQQIIKQIKYNTIKQISQQHKTKLKISQQQDSLQQLEEKFANSKTILHQIKYDIDKIQVEIDKGKEEYDRIAKEVDAEKNNNVAVKLYLNYSEKKEQQKIDDFLKNQKEKLQTFLKLQQEQQSINSAKISQNSLIIDKEKQLNQEIQQQSSIQSQIQQLKQEINDQKQFIQQFKDINQTLNYEENIDLIMDFEQLLNLESAIKDKILTFKHYVQENVEKKYDFFDELDFAFILENQDILKESFIQELNFKEENQKQILQEQRLELEFELSQYQSKLQNHNKNKNQVQQIEEELLISSQAIYNQRLRELEQKIISFEEQCHLIQVEIERFQAEINKINQESNDLKTQQLIPIEQVLCILAIQEQIAHLSQSIEKQQQNWANLNQEYSSIQTQQKEINQQIDKVASLEEKFTFACAEIQEQLKKTNEEIAKYMNLKQKISAFEQTIKQLGNTNDVKKDEQVTERDTTELFEKITEKQKEVEELNQAISQLKTQTNQYSKIKEILEKQEQLKQKFNNPCDCQRKTHICEYDCSICFEQSEKQECYQPAGHKGQHLCKKESHECKQACAICKISACKKAYGHVDDHNCNISKNHRCKENCHYCQKNPCQFEVMDAHSEHLCIIEQCIGKCQLCGNSCVETKNHKHSKESTHFCNSSHACNQKCNQKGICYYDYPSESRVWKSQRGEFKYEYKVPKSQKYQCALTIPAGKLFHEQDHNCGKNPHTCNQQCLECLAFCDKPAGHDGKHKSSNHRNKDIQIFVQDVCIEEKGKGAKFYEAGESSTPENCSQSCYRRGRGHFHLKECKKENCAVLDKNLQGFSEHGFLYKDKIYDKIFCLKYWESYNWEAPIEINTITEEEHKVQFCNFYCAHYTHGKQKIYCSKDAWHSLSMNSKDHLFTCTEQHEEQKQFHGIQICFCIDTTGSMSNYIEQTKKACKEVVQKAESYLKMNDIDSKDLIQFAVVDYNDHENQGALKYRDLKPFAALCSGWQNESQIQVYLNQLTADGGGDGPEAVLDGLHLSSLLHWEQSKEKFMFVIGDAPPHGKDFHNGSMNDVWPDDNEPCKLKIEPISLALRSITGIPLKIYFWKINECLNILIKKMRDQGLEIEELELGSNSSNSVKFENKVAELICQRLEDKELTVLDFSMEKLK